MIRCLIQRLSHTSKLLLWLLTCKSTEARSLPLTASFAKKQPLLLGGGGGADSADLHPRWPGWVSRAWEQPDLGSRISTRVRSGRAACLSDPLFSHPAPGAARPPLGRGILRTECSDGSECPAATESSLPGKRGLPSPLAHLLPKLCHPLCTGERRHSPPTVLSCRTSARACP